MLHSGEVKERRGGKRDRSKIGLSRGYSENNETR